MAALGFERRPGDVGTLQALAALGQPRLMERYNRCLATHGLVAGQVQLYQRTAAWIKPRINFAFPAALKRAFKFVDKDASAEQRCGVSLALTASGLTTLGLSPPAEEGAP